MSAAASPLPVDSLGLWGRTLDLPGQLAAPAPDQPSTTDRSVDQVLLMGVGTAGLAADAAAELARPRSPRPLLTWHGGPLPASVGPGTVALVLGRPAGRWVLDEAARSAAEVGAEVVAIDGQGPEQAAFGPLVAGALRLLERRGLAGGMARDLAGAAGFVAERMGSLADPAGEPAAVARRIGRTIPLVHGSAGPVAVAARRWKSQVNLNAKAPAFAAELPDLAHDEIAGWGQHGDVTRQVLTLVRLRTPDEPPGVARAFDRVAELVDEVVADRIEVWATGPDPVTRFFELVLVGDLVSLHLAGREGIDPGPTPSVESVGA